MGGLEAQPRSFREAVVAVSAVAEIHENIGWALDRAGLPSDALGPIGLAGPGIGEERGAELVPDLLSTARGFIAELPTRDAALRLRLLRAALGYRAGKAGMRVLSKAAEFTWRGDGTMRSDLAHVVASDQIEFEQIGGRDVEVRGWPQLPDAEHEKWAEQF